MFIKASVAKVSIDPVVNKWNSLRERIVELAILEFIKDKREAWDKFYQERNINRPKKKGYFHPHVWNKVKSIPGLEQTILDTFKDIIYQDSKLVIQVNEPGVKKFLKNKQLTLSTAYASPLLESYINKTIKQDQFRNLMEAIKNAEPGKEVKCIYCNKPINFTKSMSGLDRLSKNYTPGTLVPCCYDCNLLKGKYSPNKFIDLVYKIQQNLKNKNIQEEKSPAFQDQIKAVDKILGAFEAMNQVDQSIVDKQTSIIEDATLDENISENNEQLSLPLQTKTSSLKKRIKKISKLLKSSLDNSRTHKHSSSKSIRYNKLQEIFKAAQGVLPEVYHADEPDQASELWDTRAEAGDEYERRLKLLRQLAEEEARADHPLEPKDDPSFISDTLKRPFDKDDQDVFDDDLPF